MRVTRVDFDSESEVERVHIVVESLKEVRYLFKGYSFPDNMEMPLKFTYTKDVAAEVFHAAGKVAGIHEDYDIASNVYYALMMVVDRLIEYDT